MAPVEVTPDGVPAGTPWARSAAEIDEVHAELAGRLARIAARPGRTVDQLTPGEHYALGVRAAAQWALGRSLTAPLTDDVLPPDLGSAVKVMALAEYLMNSEGTPERVAALAAGVHAWTVWLVGAADRMDFRPLD